MARPRRCRQDSTYAGLLIGTSTTEVYTLSLHDALPIWMAFHNAATHRITASACWPARISRTGAATSQCRRNTTRADRKSTRLNSSHVEISYAVFCLKKKNGGEACNFCVWRCVHGFGRAV